MNRASLVCCDWAFLVHRISGNVKDPAENGFSYWN